MPIPKPRKDEDKDKFMSRCISFLRDEGTPQEQAVAICNTQWGKKKMSNDTILKGLNVEIKEADDKERTITAIGSKEVVDRSGDIVMVEGMDLKNFKKNPVVMLSHNYSEFPIGKAVGKKVWVEDKKLMFKIQFATAEENPKAEQAYKLYKGGYLNAFSLGFRPNYEKTEYPENHAKGARRIFHEAELLEVSVVAIPDNQEALRAGINKAWEAGILDGEELNTWEEMIKNTETTKEVEDKSDDKEDLTKALREAECKIAELTLQLKEQEMEEEVENDIYTEIFNEFGLANSDESSADVEQIDETAEDYLNSLLEEE